MIFFNANIYRGIKEGFVLGEFEVEKGFFGKITSYKDPSVKESRKEDGKEKRDLKGAYVIPGLIDIHHHGNCGADFCDGDADKLAEIGAFLLKRGITSFLPASMTLPLDRLSGIFKSAKALVKNPPQNISRIMGIRMEGPFLSEKHKGAQKGEYLLPPDYGSFRELYEECGQIIRIIDIAPELYGANDFIRMASGVCRVSLAHTDATYEEAEEAFKAGAGHITHLFNAMNPLHHRAPGVIGAAYDNKDITVELICDGLHIHPSVIRMAFEMFKGRVCLISDAARCLGMPDGVYEFGGQEVILKDRRLTLKDGTIAASVTDLYDCMLNAVKFGISKEEAVYSATMIPAGVIGYDDIIGSLETGKYADFVICDSELNRKEIYFGGRKV
ncbi:MAG: N-acetylglucosamine-6-phosphate deacetylase [Lachnospiraceae bacterium]|nr:N-acetylglucosamine-6-phosphate deacetylase [Lachnospiraceae bacterium]